MFTDNLNSWKAQNSLHKQIQELYVQILYKTYYSDLPSVKELSIILIIHIFFLIHIILLSFHFSIHKLLFFLLLFLLIPLHFQTSIVSV